MDIRSLNQLLALTEEEQKALFHTKKSERQMDKKLKKSDQVERSVN